MNLTVGELKKRLAELPDDMFVGKVGHFGEMNFMTAGDLYTRMAYYNVDKSGKPTGRWRSTQGSKEIRIEVLDINTPNIGEEPE